MHLFLCPLWVDMINFLHLSVPSAFTKAERLDHLQEALEVPDTLHSVGSGWTCYIPWSRSLGKASCPTDFPELQEKANSSQLKDTLFLWVKRDAIQNSRDCDEMYESLMWAIRKCQATTISHNDHNVGAGKWHLIHLMHGWRTLGSPDLFLLELRILLTFINLLAIVDMWHLFTFRLLSSSYYLLFLFPPWLFVYWAQPKQKFSQSDK